MKRRFSFLGIKKQGGYYDIPEDMINKITALSPLTKKGEAQAFSCCGLLKNAYSGLYSCFSNYSLSPLC